jgi:four helix bundle protein
MRDFRELRVWQAAHACTLRVYHHTTGFPRAEQFGLTAQLRDSANSVGASIAEGCGRATDPDARRFFHIANGSLFESLHHVILARDLGYLAAEDFAELDRRMEQIRRMLARLIQAQEGNRPAGRSGPRRRSNSAQRSDVPPSSRGPRAHDDDRLPTTDR